MIKSEFSPKWGNNFRMIMILSKQWLKKYIPSKPNTDIDEWSRMYWNWSRKLNTEPMVIPIILQIVLNVNQIRIFTKKAEIVQRTFYLTLNLK